MIYILYGKNIDASYTRLLSLFAKYPDHLKIRLDEKTTTDEVNTHLYSTTLFKESKLIVFENYLVKLPKIDLSIFAKAKDHILIFWEKSAVPKNVLSKFTKIAYFEEFKPEPVLFWFLDNIYPGNKKILATLVQIDPKGLLYQLQNRLFLLILSKLGASQEFVQNNIQKNLQSWQFEKIKRQAGTFTPNSLFSIYNGALKIDYMIKKGQTDIADTTLIKLLLLKYL